jgi:Domain of unknown function (DUF4942)
VTTALIPSVSIANLVSQRAAVMERITQAVGLLREAAEIAQAGHLGMPLISMSTTSSSYGKNLADARLGARLDGSTWEHAESERAEISKMIRVGIDSAAWQYLMHESGLRSLMDASAREKWDKAIRDGDVPELTDANIRSTFSMLHDSRGDMFERGVIACFKALSWAYKTNLPQKFGKRIVITYLTGSYSHSKCDQLDDLVRVLAVLDGKPEPDYRGGTYAALSKAGLNGWPCKAGVVETDYLSIRTFKNHNGHVTFKRPELVEKMNLIIAKHYPGALPAPK